MSEHIYSSKFLDMHYEAEKSLILYIWRETTAEMLSTEYKIELLEIVKFSEKYQIAKHLVDTQLFAFIVDIDMQEWVAQNFYPHLVASGSKKFSFVVSPDLFAQVTLEQAVEGGRTADVVESKYFNDIDQARAWALED